MSIMSDIKDPAFFKSFSKGALWSVLLLFGFVGIAVFNGASYEQKILEKTAFVAVPITMTTPAPHHQQQGTHQEVKDAHADPHTPHETVSHDETRHDEDHYNDSSHPPPSHHQERAAEDDHHGHDAPLVLYKDGMIEDTANGKLPKPRTKDGLTPFDAYKRDFIVPLGQTKIHIIVRPSNYSVELSKSIAENLPKDISLLVSPYDTHIRNSMRAYRGNGQEVWLELPIETAKTGTHDTGPLSLRSDFSREQNIMLSQKVMAQTAGYAGLFLRNIEQTTLSLASISMNRLLGNIAQRGLGIAYAAADENPHLHTIANEHSGALIHVPQTIPPRPFSLLQDDLDKMLTTQENISLLLTLYPNDVTALAKWLQDLPQKGYVLAPISAVLEE